MNNTVHTVRYNISIDADGPLAQFVNYSGDDIDLSVLVQLVKSRYPNLDADLLHELFRELLASGVRCMTGTNVIACTLSEWPRIMTDFIENQYDVSERDARSMVNQCIMEFLLGLLGGVDPVKAVINLFKCLFANEEETPVVPPVPPAPPAPPTPPPAPPTPPPAPPIPPTPPPAPPAPPEPEPGPDSEGPILRSVIRCG